MTLVMFLRFLGKLLFDNQFESPIVRVPEVDRSFQGTDACRYNSWVCVVQMVGPSWPASQSARPADPPARASTLCRRETPRWWR